MRNLFKMVLNKIEGITLKQFLDNCVIYDGELFGEFESKFSFCWDNTITITDEGKKKFKNILNSDIQFINGNIKLINKNIFSLFISEREYNLFLSAVAGYVNVNDYNKWFSHKKEVLI